MLHFKKHPKWVYTAPFCLFNYAVSLENINPFLGTAALSGVDKEGEAGYPSAEALIKLLFSITAW
jgi:hypothetical protein